ncbi:uncharacterized protein LOC107036223 [Diachasma alloeum]|uniref:uncharacterized protein LOC107036223 n=1 Tax=Diachasma alloeum TaxID=454923 RepID=UPI000738239F|nr:uncharacterized protein LOC107036223 [Diachasma alloeum]
MHLELDNSLSVNSNSIPEPRLLFKLTNREVFKTFLEKNYDANVPNDKNLHEVEIDNYIQYINENIICAINNIPKSKSTGNIQRDITKRITQLEKRKSSLLTRLNRRLKHDPRAKTRETKSIKLLLAQTREDLNLEFSSSIDTHWNNDFRKINFRDSERFMPMVNRIFRPKAKSDLADIHISANNETILNNSGNNLDETPLVNDKYTFSDPISKLNAIGAFYETINSPRYLNEGTRLREVIDRKVSDFENTTERERCNKEAITNFTSTNRANHSTEDSLDKYFTLPEKIALIIKNLPNKTSSGIDNIPTVVIKHLPLNVIKYFTALVNNALNLSYFPKIWKVAQVIPILKKDKNSEDPSSYRPISLTPSPQQNI